METVQKIIALVRQKYYPFIIVLDDYTKNKSISVHDSDSGALFTVVDDIVYSFRDEKANYWLTIPETCKVNGQKIYPVVGDTLICDGIQYLFTTKEAIVEMAVNYFEDFIDPHYGIKIVMQGMSFFENKNDKSDSYFVIFQKFKSRKHDKIKAFISSN
ncbi:hypothetical protein [Flavobacterium sp.]|uniref:hypothetical protein n=1 Tax=Flavobacterium sp. TaxID=239 RepID=UPI003D0A176F